METEIECSLCQRGGSGKAVQDAAPVATGILFQERNGILLGFPRVNDHRQSEFAGETHLRAKHLLLDVTRREIVMVVQPNLSDRACSRRRSDLIADQLYHAIRIARKLMCLVWMNANRRPNFGPERIEPRGL